jgi:hypothetical protein
MYGLPDKWIWDFWLVGTAGRRLFSWTDARRNGDWRM